jgi:hypothetical protein
MPDTFTLESNLFYADLETEYTPLQLRSRTTDGAIHILEMAAVVLWSARDMRCRITTASELQTFESFYFDHRATPFLIYDPTHSSIYLEGATGDGSTTVFVLDHTYVSSGTLLVYLNGVLKTETTHYTVNYTTGTITFLTAPGSAVAITASYRFRRLVLFDGGFSFSKRAIPDGQTITSVQIGICKFSLVESIYAS